MHGFALECFSWFILSCVYQELMKRQKLNGLVSILNPPEDKKNSEWRFMYQSVPIVTGERYLPLLPGTQFL